MIHAVVPVKALVDSKTRLRRGLSRLAVAQLAEAMLRDVLDALLLVSALDRVVVVTPDPDVAAVARDAGTEALIRDDPGLNAAIDAAAAGVCRDPADGLLVVLGDVAGVRAEEIARLLAAVDVPGVALAPSRDGGSSALLRVPHGVIPACFGPNSAARHRERAEQAGVAFREVALPSLAIDVDRPEDLDAVLAGGGPAFHTRAACAALAQSEK
jgi:2-phospho-L-lactate guanylyltransferase